MRRAGRIGLDRSCGPRGHLCCLYDDVAEYHRHVTAFFTEGLRDGLRVAYVGVGGPEALRADLADMPDLDRLMSEGAVHLLSLEELYRPGNPVDPERVIGSYAAATERALADGFRGLRASADGTELVRTQQEQDAMVRYEFQVGRYMNGHPLSALCGFRTSLGEDAGTELASLHAAGPSDMPGFRVFGCADGAIGLAGEFDQVTVAAFGRMLPGLRTGDDAGGVVVDMAEVRFLDHRLLLTLDAYARANGVRMPVRSLPPFATRLMELVPVPYLRPVEVGAES
jgi:anti-anti-sigma regulatory factor